MDTDIGSLKATILARGDHRADYHDIEENYDGVSQSIIMNVQAEFDQLIHNVVTKINEVLADASDPATGYMCNADGTPLQLFTAITPDVTTMFSLKNVQVNEVLQQEPSDFPLESRTVRWIMRPQKSSRQLLPNRNIT